MNIRFVIIAISLMVVCIAPTAMAGDTVLLLHSESEPTRWTSGITKGVHAALGDETLIKEIYLGTSDDEEYYIGIRDDLASSFATSAPSGVITSGRTAFSFARKFREDLFPKAPVIACSMPRPSANELSQCGESTGIPELYDFKGILELLFALRPKTKLVIGIADNSNQGKRLASRLRQAMAGHSSRADLLIPGQEPGESGMDFDGLSTLLANIPASGVVLYLGYGTDRNGNPVPADKIAPLLGQRCPAPVFTLTDALLGTGVVGGLVVTGEDVGRETARLMRRAWGGETVNEMLPDGVKPRIVADGTAMGRFGMKLPKGALLINPVEHPDIPAGATSGSWFGWLVGLLAFACLFILIRLTGRKSR